MVKKQLIVICPNKSCRQKLRLPKTEKKLLVTCPICNTEFHYWPLKWYQKGWFMILTLLLIILVFLKKISLFYNGCYLSHKTKNSVNNNLNYIFSFPEFKKRLTYHPDKFFFKPSKSFYDNCENNIQKAAEEILSHCGLSNVLLKVTHEYLHIPRELTTFLGPDPGIPGQMYSLTKYQFTVFINKNYSPKIRAAALAHEISHIYIRNNEVNFETNSPEKSHFQEQMTDLVTIALGLGRLMIEGNSYCFVEGDTEYYGTLGYVKPVIMEYAQTLMELKIWQKRRKIIRYLVKGVSIINE